MARIPVTQTPVQPRWEDDRNRRKGLPLWVWPLIPLLLGALALGLASRGGEETQRGNTGAGQGTTSGNQGTTNGNQGAANAGQGAAITDMLTVVGDQNPGSYVGRQASFANVQVQSVPGDRGFWIGPNANQQLFVVIDEANAGQSEGRIQVTPGQTLTLNGELRQLPAAGQIPAEWGFTPGTGGAAAQQVYLHARQVSAGQ